MSKKRTLKSAPSRAHSAKTSISKALGQKVQSVRRLRGLSQEELAEKINHKAKPT